MRTERALAKVAMRAVSALAWAVLVATVVWLKEGSAAGADWPQWRGPDRSGISPEKGWFVTWPPEKLWTVHVGLGYCSVAVSGDRAYVLGHKKADKERGNDTVYCLKVATGEVVWKHTYDCLSTKRDRTAEYPGPRATALVDGDAVYTVSLEGHLFCLSAESGAVRWYKKLHKYSLKDKPLMYGYCASPMVHGDTLLCYLNGACMAFDKKSGKPLWRRKGGAGPWNVPSPVLATAGDTTCVVIGEMSLVGVNVANGKKVWEYELGRSATMSPVVCPDERGDRLFFSTYPNKGRCGLLSLGAVTPEHDEPEVLWQHRRMQVYHMGNPVVWEGHLYGIDSARTEFAYSDGKVSSLKCLDLETGRQEWVEKRMGWAQLILADGKLIIMREGGELVVAEASPDGYNELGRAKVIEGPIWAVPALADGRIYCRNNEGEAVCLQVGEKRPAAEDANKGSLTAPPAPRRPVSCCGSP